MHPVPPLHSITSSPEMHFRLQISNFVQHGGHHFADLYGQLQVIAYDIPFPSLIDWDSIAFFARSMAEIGQCDHGQRETFKFLDALGGKTLQTPSPVSACFATGIVCVYLESLLVFHTV